MASSNNSISKYVTVKSTSSRENKEKTKEKTKEKEAKRGSDSVQPNKRTHSEVANSSGDDIMLIMNELAEIKSELKATVKNRDLEKNVKEMVATLVKETRSEFSNQIAEMKKEHEKENLNLQKRIDWLEEKNLELTEANAERARAVRVLENQFEDLEEIALEASARSNYNEQYSRKNNIKIHGVQESQGEDTAEVVSNLLADVAKIRLDEDDVIALHRVPGKPRVPRPILVKLKNSNAKAKIMRKRSDVKNAGKGMRLSDDVTKRNSDLIQRLQDHDHIYQAWYFNGGVYAKTTPNGKRIKFDIHDNIDEKVNRRKSGPHE
ncbi:hypothetical protein FSP39_005463 [Pinctada imbricata]|uniref:Uncharacterized protein n=1 Tax=Pinctada imbricata TaxID=66713 RepID=A0AA89BSP5_PINIB|nr:hypothetical protein FSP39_005463 [Pinctada imbricata]